MTLAIIYYDLLSGKRTKCRQYIQRWFSVEKNNQRVHQVNCNQFHKCHWNSAHSFCLAAFMLRFQALDYGLCPLLVVIDTMNSSARLVRWIQLRLEFWYWFEWHLTISLMTIYGCLCHGAALIEIYITNNAPDKKRNQSIRVSSMALIYGILVSTRVCHFFFIEDKKMNWIKTGGQCKCLRKEHWIASWKMVVIVEILHVYALKWTTTIEFVGINYICLNQKANQKSSFFVKKSFDIVNRWTNDFQHAVFTTVSSFKFQEFSIVK